MQPSSQNGAKGCLRHQNGRKFCLVLRHRRAATLARDAHTPIFGTRCAAPRADWILKGDLVPGKKAPLERRRHERIPLAIPVFVRGADGEGKEFLEFATALNISAGGALLATRRYLPRLAQLSLEIPSAPLPRLPVLPRAARRLRARLLRATALDGFQLWGLKFSSALVAQSVSRRKVPSER
jgi:PilZ domain